MSQIGGPRENPKIQEPSAEREDFLDDGVSEIENSIESHIRDLKKLVLSCRGVSETLHTEVGIKVYEVIKDLAESIISTLDSISEDDLRSVNTQSILTAIEDFMVDQQTLVDMFNNTDDYSEEDVFMGAETLKEAYAEL